MQTINFKKLIKKVKDKLPFSYCKGVRKIAAAAKSIIKNINTGANQWMSRLFFGGLVKTKDNNYQLDELSLLCKSPHWESLLEKNKAGVLIVEEIFKNNVLNGPRPSTAETSLMQELVLARRTLLKINADHTTIARYNEDSEVEQKKPNASIS